MQPRTVHELPADYHEVYVLRLSERLLQMNLAAIPLLILSIIVFIGWLLLYHSLGASLVQNWLPDDMPLWMGAILLFGVLLLHELLHGLAIQWVGHRTRYGAKLGMLYATADGGYFWRNQYRHVALAPLLWISLLVVLASLFFPAKFSLWLMYAAIINASGATGDLWMAWKLRKFPPEALVRDEEDAMRVFLPN